MADFLDVCYLLLCLSLEKSPVSFPYIIISCFAVSCILKHILGFRHMIFYDMGAQDTTATVVGYQIVKTKERGFAETHPQVGHFIA